MWAGPARLGVRGEDVLGGKGRGKLTEKAKESHSILKMRSHWKALNREGVWPPEFWRLDGNPRNEKGSRKAPVWRLQEMLLATDRSRG